MLHPDQGGTGDVQTLTQVMSCNILQNTRPTDAVAPNFLMPSATRVGIFEVVRARFAISFSMHYFHVTYLNVKTMNFSNF